MPAMKFLEVALPETARENVAAFLQERKYLAFAEALFVDANMLIMPAGEMLVSHSVIPRG